MRINLVPFFCRIRVELARDRRDRDRDGGDRRGGGRDGGRGGGRYDDRGGKYYFAIGVIKTQGICTILLSIVNFKHSRNSAHSLTKQNSHR